MNTAKIIKAILVIAVVIAAIVFIWKTIQKPEPAQPVEVPSERDRLVQTVQAASSTVDSELRAKLEAKVRTMQAGGTNN